MRSRHFAAVAAVIGLSVAVPAAAHASGLITVLSVSSPAGNLGLVSVTLESTTPVVPSSITAEFLIRGSSTPTLTVNDFTLTGGVNSGATVTTWTVAAPITTSELPLGIYSITVLAADTGGDTADAAGAGILDFRVTPTLTFSVAPESYSYGQKVTLSGTETGTYPDGSTGPLAGQTVTVHGVDASTAITDSTGTFSLTLTAGIPDDALVPVSNPYLWASVADTATTKAADSGVVAVTIVPDPFRVTNLIYAPETISYRGAVAVSGDVSYDVGGTWLPFANKSVEIDFDGYSETPCDPDNECSSEVATANTDATGAFAVTMADSGGTEQYSLIAQYPDWSQSPWFTEPTTDFVVTVNHVPTSSRLATAARDIHNRLTLRGCIGQNVSDVFPRLMAPYPAATFQYARHPKGPWRTVPGTGPIADNSIPPSGPGHCYSATARAPGGIRVFYRMSTPASVAYLAQASPAEHARQPSRVRFKDVTARPASLRSGQRVRVTGQLSRLVSTKVQILFRPDGAGRWRALKTVLTYFAGQNGWASFSAAVTLHQSGDVAARFPGLPEIYPLQSRSIHVAVN